MKSGKNSAKKIFQAAREGFSVKTLTSIVVPLYAKMGIQTGKTRTEVLADPPGKVIVVEVLCAALAKHGMSLVTVHQVQTRGAVLEAKLPSDFWSYEGKVLVTVEPGTFGGKDKSGGDDKWRSPASSTTGARARAAWIRCSATSLHQRWFLDSAKSSCHVGGS